MLVKIHCPFTAIRQSNFYEVMVVVVDFIEPVENVLGIAGGFLFKNDSFRLCRVAEAFVDNLFHFAKSFNYIIPAGHALGIGNPTNGVVPKDESGFRNSIHDQRWVTLQGVSNINVLVAKGLINGLEFFSEVIQVNLSLYLLKFFGLLF